MALTCIDLIGMDYCLGGDGTSRQIDCINLVYITLKEVGIATPPFNHGWYEMPTRQVLRHLLQWGKRIDHLGYDGDVVLLPQDRWAFAAVWNQGILHISSLTKQVAWCPFWALKNAYYFRTRSS